MRDPIGTGGQPTGPLRAALELRPAAVVLLHTAGSIANAEATCWAIQQATSSQPVAVHLLRLEGDPTHQEVLLRQVRDHIEDLRRAGAFRSGGRVHVCGTSGTPQMRTALVLAVGNRFPTAMFWEALDPSKANGGELLRSVEPNVLRVWTLLCHGFRLLRGGRPAEAAAALERAAGSDLLDWSLAHTMAAVRLAELLHNVSEYALSDATVALMALTTATEATPSAPMQRLVEWYGRVLAVATDPGRPGPDWAAEMAAMAIREHESGRRVLGMVRLASAVEVTFAVRLQEAHGICPTNLGDQRDRVGHVLGETAIEVSGDRAYVRTWSDELRLLGALEAGEFRMGTQPGGLQLDRARRLFRARNELLHVGTAVSREEFDGAFAGGRELVSWLLERFSWRRLPAVPSLPGGIRAAVDVLADRAGIAVAS
jgi:hypothetical protein